MAVGVQQSYNTNESRVLAESIMRGLLRTGGEDFGARSLRSWPNWDRRTQIEEFGCVEEGNGKPLMATKDQIRWYKRNTD
jgi:hypothetical protein